MQPHLDLDLVLDIPMRTALSSGFGQWKDESDELAGLSWFQSKSRSHVHVELKAQKAVVRRARKTIAAAFRGTMLAMVTV